MRRAVRVGLVVLGASTAVYGAASLTGGWLGTPPWWERRLEFEERSGRTLIPVGVHPDSTPPRSLFTSLHAVPTHDPREGREWISGGVVAASLALVAVGTWPWRRKAAPQDAARPEHRGEA